MSALLDIVMEIIDAAGVREAFELSSGEETFTIRFEQEGFDPFVIESFTAIGRHLFDEKLYIYVSRPIVLHGFDVVTTVLEIVDSGEPFGIEQSTGYLPVHYSTYSKGSTFPNVWHINLAAKLYIARVMDRWAQTIRDENWIDVANKSKKVHNRQGN